jgi:hypothetical protein
MKMCWAFLEKIIICGFMELECTIIVTRRLESNFKYISQYFRIDGTFLRFEPVIGIRVSWKRRYSHLHLS